VVLSGITSAKQLLGATVGVGVAKTLCILIAAPLLDHYGRRRMLLVSSAGLTMSLLLLGVSFSLGSPVILALTAQVLFVSSFSIGFGPASYIISSEITPLRVRGRAMSLGTLLNRLVSGTVALTFLSISDVITAAGTFYSFAVISLFSFLFVYKVVFETKGRSLEDIEQQLKLGLHQNDNERDLGTPEPIPLSSDEVNDSSSSAPQLHQRVQHHNDNNNNNNNMNDGESNKNNMSHAHTNDTLTRGLVGSSHDHVNDDELLGGA
jgi:MFS family permease